jgi:hypothetical protein
MFSRSKCFRILLAVLAVFALAACGGSSQVGLNDLPVYPDAVELKEGESVIADTLANNNQTDVAFRGQIGMGGSVEQKGFSLPAGTSWDDVKSFYDEKLKADGWGTNSMVSGIMEQTNQGNDMFQTANWQKNKQNVTVMILASPMNPDEKELILSLSSQ